MAGRNPGRQQHRTPPLLGGADLLVDIETAEHRAHRNGFHVTAHALNRAKNALGWEMAGDVIKAGKASRDER